MHFGFHIIDRYDYFCVTSLADFYRFAGFHPPNPSHITRYRLFFHYCEMEGTGNEHTDELIYKEDEDNNIAASMVLDKPVHVADEGNEPGSSNSPSSPKLASEWKTQVEETPKFQCEQVSSGMDSGTYTPDARGADYCHQQYEDNNQDTDSTRGEQEVKIEYLAQALADNLHKEHPIVHSIFNFEEFETEQQYHEHQERLQLHLYQQHIMHQQEIQRQQGRARRQDLHINIDDGSKYSSNPSPGSKYLTHQQSAQSPSIASGQNSPAWYRAEDSASYINRSGSLCSRRDRLYEVKLHIYLTLSAMLTSQTAFSCRQCPTSTSRTRSCETNTLPSFPTSQC